LDDGCACWDRPDRLFRVRQLEVRRHSFTKKGDGRGRGSHQSAEGVRAARAIGELIGPVAYVAASEAPRTAETGIAPGLSVDDLLPMGLVYVSTVAHHDQWSWPSPFLRYRELLDEDSTLALAAVPRTEAPADGARSTARALPSSWSRLLVTRSDVSGYPGDHVGVWRETGAPPAHQSSARRPRPVLRLGRRPAGRPRQPGWVTSLGLILDSGGVLLRPVGGVWFPPPLRRGALETRLVVGCRCPRDRADIRPAVSG
jgi:hypothetical protein